MRRASHRGPWIGLAAALAIASCADPSAEKSLAAAQSHLARHELDKAVIEAKNALKARPEFAEARLVLASALLEADDATAAALELRKLVDAGHQPDDVVPMLARAHVLAGEWRKVLELDTSAALTRPEAQAALKTQVANAHARLGATDRARAALAKALELAPSHAPAQVLQARLLAAAGDLDGARQWAARALVGQPDDAEARLLDAELKMAQGDRAGAVAAFRSVLAVQPRHVIAHTGLIEEALGRGDLAGARAQIEVLRQARPRHPQTVYLHALVSAQSGEMQAADEGVKQLLKAGIERPQVLMLAGALALKNGELQQAEQHFGKAMKQVPAAAAPRLMLARIAMRSGNPSEALRVLQPLVDAADAEPTAIALAGAARLMSGEAEAAERAFARAAEQRPGDAGLRTALSLSRLVRGDPAALEQLDAIAGQDAGEAADLALISAHLRRRDFDAAVKAADRLVAKQPGRPGPLFSRGQVLRLRGDLAGARASFERAIATDAKYFPPVLGLAELDVREGKLAAAHERLSAATQADPRNAVALLALAEVEDREGRPREQVVATLAKAVAAKPADAGLRRRVVEFHLRKSDAPAALAAARDAAAALPDNAEVIETLARAQVVGGQPQQAVSSYHKLIAMRPKAAEPLVGLAGAQYALKDASGALASLRKALDLAPGHEEANSMTVALLLASGKADDAASFARALVTERPEQPLGHELVGDVARESGRFADAVAAYREAWKRSPHGRVALKLHRALHALGERRQADAFAQSWLKQHPRDAAFLMQLGIVATAVKDHAGAERRYREVIEIEPDNAMALNNLAWTLRELRTPGGLEYAERASRLRPNVPAIMDTHAALLADDGQTTKALEVQRAAVQRAPDAPEFRLALAKLLLRSGAKDQARAELERLHALGERYAGRREVEGLLAGLR